MNRLRNVDIRKKLQQEGVLGMVKSRQKWKAKLEDMSMERTIKMFEGEMQGNRPRGRPRLS